MKNLLLLLALFVSLFSFSGETVNLKISYSFSHIEVGYDHPTKCRVYIDGNMVLESAEHKESEPQSFSIKVAKGKHTVRIVIYNYYEGVWEEHNVENNYSTNASYERELMVKKKSAIALEFDLDQTNPIIKKG